VCLGGGGGGWRIRPVCSSNFALLLSLIFYLPSITSPPTHANVSRTYTHRSTYAGLRGVPADISLGAGNGAAAVDFVRRQVLAVPPLRPLTLVLKAMLREKGLNEVFTGGVSSYTLVNMVRQRIIAAREEWGGTGMPHTLVCVGSCWNVPI
jgi:hypothetical protein